MIEECLEFLISTKDYSDLQVNRAKLACLLKITIFVKQSVIFSYPLVVNNLISSYKELLGNCYFNLIIL